jgi:hypothetical protein
VAASTINVKDFGATGNGTIDDTTAIQAAASVFTAAMVANVSTRLYFPAGKYLISAPIAVQGIVGGVIEGDGMYASQIVGNSNVSGLRGALGVLVLTNCQHVTVRDISVSSGNQFTTFTGCSAGALSITVTSATGLVAGMRIGLMVSGAQAEEAHILAVSGTTVTLAQPTLYAYATGSYVFSGVLGCVTCYSNALLFPLISHANKFERVLFNGPSSLTCLYGFATACLGGAPTFLTGSVTGGASTSAVVKDVSQMVVGQTVRIWDSIAAANEFVTVTGITLATNTFSIAPATFVNNHSVNAYVVSPSDANNDEHVFSHCVSTNGVVGCYGISGWNSLNLLITDSEAGASNTVVTARQGGSVKWKGGDAQGYTTTFEFGGGQQQPQIMESLESETSSSFLLVHSNDNTQSLQVWASNIITKGVPASGNLIDVTAAFMICNFRQCSFAPGLSPGNSTGLRFYDLDSAGLVTLSGGCYIGPDIVILNGTVLIDYDSTWTSISTVGQPPTETISNGGGVRAIAASYGFRNEGGAGSVERRPVLPITLANGANDGVINSGDSDLLVTGPTGAFSVKGFRCGCLGQRLRVKFNVNQQLTIVNNSSSSIPILTGTGANVIFAAPGGFLIIDFWCDGTNWNVV